MWAGTCPRRSNSSPITLTCMLTCIRAWAGSKGLPSPAILSSDAVRRTRRSATQGCSRGCQCNCRVGSGCPVSGSPVTLPPNRAYSFYRTRLSLYLFPGVFNIREFTRVKQVVALKTEYQCLSVSSSHHLLPELFSSCDILHASDMVNLKWSLLRPAIFSLVGVEPSYQL